MSDSLDVSKFFEDAATRLGLPADQLADFVNRFDDVTTSQWVNLFDGTGVEIADIAAVRATLVEMHSRHQAN